MTTWRGPRREDLGPDDGGGETNVTATINHPGIGGVERDRGCPCGCTTRPPWIDDPECIRHAPLGDEIDWADGPIGVVDQGGLRITSLREWRWAS